MDPTQNNNPTPQADPTPAPAAPVVNNNPAPAQPAAPQNPAPTNPAPQAPAAPANNGDNFSNIDPNTLPPELKAFHQGLQSDYTKKMQEISAVKDKYSKYENFLPIWDEMLSPAKQADPNAAPKASPIADAITKQLAEAGYNQESIDFANMLVSQITKAQEADKQQVQTQQYVDTKTKEVEEAYKLDARLTDQNLKYNVNGQEVTFGSLVEKIVLSDSNWHKDVNGSIKNAVAYLDAIANAGKTQGKQELSQQARDKSGKFTPVNSSPQAAVNNDQPMTVRDAFLKAREQMAAGQ